jgi:uncharacterized protein YodC (DUF2158 family)
MHIATRRGSSKALRALTSVFFLFWFSVSNVLALTPMEEDGLYIFNEKDVRPGKFLSITGLVFDVSADDIQYSHGMPFYRFTGKDTTRLFMGKPIDDRHKEDDISDATGPECLAVDRWVSHYHSKDKYLYAGVLEGRWFDKRGRETKAFQDFRKCVEDAKREQMLEQEQYERERAERKKHKEL